MLQTILLLRMYIVSKMCPRDPKKYFWWPRRPMLAECLTYKLSGDCNGTNMLVHSILALYVK